MVQKPAGAQLDDQSRNIVQVANVGSVDTTYALKDALNQSTLKGNSQKGHFGTSINVTKYPKSVTIVDPIDAISNFFVESQAITLSNGAKAWLLTQRNEYGAVRVDWSYHGHSYLMISNHWKARSGTSGVPTSNLLKMAGSIS